MRGGGAGAEQVRVLFTPPPFFDFVISDFGNYRTVNVLSRAPEIPTRVAMYIQRDSRIAPLALSYLNAILCMRASLTSNMDFHSKTETACHSIPIGAGTSISLEPCVPRQSDLS